MFGHRPNSNQARICVLGFSANRVWLVSRFYIFTTYYKVRTFSIPTSNTIGLCELLWSNDLRHRSLDMEVRESQVRSSDQDLLFVFLFFILFPFFPFRFSFSLVFHFVFNFLWFFFLFSDRVLLNNAPIGRSACR